MTWGKELWDQYDNISKHTENGIIFCDKIGHFYKEFVSIEADYAGKLQRLVKSYLPKKKEEEEFTCSQGFFKSLKELKDIAGQHETIVENITNNICKDLATFINEIKTERRKLLAEGSKLQSTYTNQLDRMEKSKKQYEKAFKEAEKATEIFRKNEMDENLAKIEIDKSKLAMQARQQFSEDCKAAYALEVDKSQKLQRDHFETLLPDVFDKIQMMDERRIMKIRDLIITTSSILQNTMPIISKCIEGIQSSNSIILPDMDSNIFIAKNKTGYTIPEIAFEDLSNSNNNKPSGSTKRQNTISDKKSRLFSIFTNKNELIKEDYSHLPPSQQKKQLLIKIDSIKNTIQKQNQERDGLMKMRDVYASNKKLGDPEILEKQLAENANHIDKNIQELKKYEAYLSASEDKTTPQTSPYSQRKDSIPLQTTKNNPVIRQSSDNTSKEIKSQDSVNSRNSFSDEEEGAIQQCIALYDYPGTGDPSTLNMVMDEKFDILMQDEGDGWLKVRNTNGEMGYVPSSYVRMI